MKAARAQTAAKSPTVPVPGSSVTLEEVIVTAQKRAENLQEVPISVQVIGHETLAEQNHNTLEELSQTVPGVHIRTESFANTLFIRGVGSDGNPGFEQSVAIFSDDIYHGRSRMSGGTFLDLDRIEVLKGPQSTFFGNNAIAGALNIVSKKPGNAFEADARLLYGQFDQYAAEGAVSGPITDTFGARLAVTRNGDWGGWIRNVNTSEKIPRVNNEAARLTLVYSPSDALDATLKIEASRHTTAGASGDQPYQWNLCPPPPPIPVGSISFGACTQALALNAQAPGTVPMGLDNNLTSGLPGQGNSLSTFEDVLTANYRLGDHTLTSVTGFNNYHADVRTDNGNLPMAIINNDVPESFHQFSQELRIASPIGERLEYLAGLYVQTDHVDYPSEINAPFLNALTTVPNLAIKFPDFSQSERVYSVFGSLSWKITDKLKVDAGLRGSWVSKNYTGTLEYGTSDQLFGGFVPLPPASQPVPFLGAPETQYKHHSDRDWMPSVGLQYQLNPDAMLYASFRRGFKAGGFNGLVPLSTPQNSIEFGPEHVSAYELGIKSKWLEDKLLLNVDIFRGDYLGLQVNEGVFVPAINAYLIGIRNAAESRSQGAELDAQWAVTHDFRLAANVTYLDTYYVNYPNGPLTNLDNFCAGAPTDATCIAKYPIGVPPVHNYEGIALNYSPRWSGSMTATYSVSLPSDYKLTSELSPYYSSDFYADPGVAADRLYPPLGGYVRLDARVGLASSNGRWRLDLLGKNMTNRVILTTYNTKQQPRNVALQVRYHW